MLRLSKRAWNNVLIFAMLGLILALNWNRFFSQDETSTRLIVPEGEFILSMQINQVMIEKAGMVWRINPNGVQANTQASSETLAEIVSAWQKAYIAPAGFDFDSQLFANPEVIVTLSLAGQSMPTVIAFKIIEQQLFVVIDKRVFVLMSPPIKSLLEPIVEVTQ
ncbi:hypothetical protein [Glaciecola petra]|uniref:DUF4340 domain-containing protein n=1 Tax=Glaciecola petra TaxID=3075602 RepID=A0ABU2ZXY2_9ALTE|nr:hypothetical protein [Aestuariibacter sp. P117]MDT0596434.1 hypothetical protein [Aestuariibacter sp. P117]